MGCAANGCRPAADEYFRINGIARYSGAMTRTCRRRPVFEALEPRILYSADLNPIAVGLSAPMSLSALMAVSAPVAQEQTHNSAGPVATNTAPTSVELAVIDSAIAGADQLLNDLQAQQSAGRAILIVRVDAGQDGIAEVSAALDNIAATGRLVSAIHLIGHGDASGTNIGDTRIDMAALRSRALEFANWSSTLTQDADLLLYGCDIAANGRSQQLAQGLAQLTGADVAASDDLTGSALRGGDWTLEYQTGQIDASNAISDAAQRDWDHVLATFTVTNTNDSGAGSLRAAITAANASGGADTVQFAIGAVGSSQTINLLSALPQINDRITIDGRSQGGVGYTGAPLIRIDGAAAGSAIGISLAGVSDGSTIQGLMITRFSQSGIFATGTNGNTFVGNYVGTDGNVALGNQDGLVVDNSNNNIIGGSTIADRNVVSGNNSNGIGVYNNSSNNLIQGNLIGRNASNTASIGNTFAGVNISSSLLNQIGGVGAGNTIAANSVGIAVQGAPSSGNEFRQNTIYGNVGMGIDLNWDGPTANDALDGDTGPNALQNSPALSSATTNGANYVRIVGSVNTTASTSLRIDFYAASELDTGLATAQGRRYLGSFSGSSNGTGDLSFNTVVSGVLVAETEYLVATTTNTATSNTSEFSNALVAQADGAGVSILPVVSVSGGETRVNTVTANTQYARDDAGRGVAMDGNGNYVIAFLSDGQDGDQFGVYAQRFDRLGNAIGGNFLVNSTTANNQEAASVTMNASGQFVIVWRSNQSGNYDIYGQRYDASGASLGAEFRVNTTTAGDQNHADVAIAADGSFIVTWDLGGASARVMMQRFDVTGATIGGEVQVSQGASGSQDTAMISIAADGRFAVVWESSQNGTDDVFARRYSADGTALGNEFQVNTTSTGTQNFAAIAMDARGRLAVTWESSQSGSLDVYLRVYDGAGMSLSGEVLVNQTTTNTQSQSRVAVDGRGNIAVTWTSNNQDGSQHGVYARRFSGAGIAVGNEFRVNTTTATEQWYSSIAVAADGRLVISWDGQGPGDSTGVFTQRYAPALVSSESGASASLIVLLDRAASAAVQIPVSLSDLTEGSLGALTQLTFNPGNWATPQVITVTGVDDNLADGTVVYNLVTGAIASIDQGYAGLNAADVALQNLDNDVALTISGNSTVGAGNTYTLNLSASDPDGVTITSWTINWGDGAIQTIAGNPTSASHVYAATLTGRSLNIMASAVDADGTHFAADLLVPSYLGTDDVRRFSSSAAIYAGAFAPFSDGLDDQVEVVQGPNGNLFVSGISSNNVLQYTTSGTLVNTFVAAGSGGLNGAAGLAFGADGNLYVSSFNTGQILRYNGSTGAFMGTFVAAGSGGLAAPLGLNFGPDGKLYVANRGANNILRFDAGTGAFDGSFNGNMNGGTPEDFTFGPDGNIYASDLTGPRVVRISAATGAYMGNFVSVSAGGLLAPTGLAFGPDGNLYVSDQSGNAIRRYDGSTGAFIANHVASGANGLQGPTYIAFTAGQQVRVTSPANITVSAISGNVSEAGATATFSVVLTSAPTADVTIAIASNDASEGTVSSPTLTFTNANWNVAQLVTVTGVDDTVIDGNVAFTIVTAPALSSDGNYNGSNAADVAATNIDNDTFNTIYVDTTSDVVDGVTFSLAALEANRGADGRISLREAILAANNTVNGIGNADKIYFSIADPLVAGAHTIQLLSALPTISDTIIIDGRTDPDFAGTPIIELDGTSAGGAANGLSFAASASGNAVRGLAINRFSSGLVIASGSIGNLIQANYVGTDVTGTIDRGNALSGISVDGDGSLIGGDNAGERNLISGNDGYGVYIGSSGDNNVISGNWIGIDSSGNVAMGNGFNGIYLAGGSGNRVGGTALGEGNVVSGHSDIAVWLAGGTGLRVQGNLIGTSADGLLAIGNLVGVSANFGATNVLIGGTNAAAANQIVNNNIGVRIHGTATDNIAVLGNRISNNGLLGIDLAANGITANDPGDADGGPNAQQNFPVLTSAVSSAGNTTIIGSLNSTASTDFRIEFFSSATADSSGHGGAQVLLGYTFVTTDGTGNANFNSFLSGVSVTVGHTITAIATVDLGGGNYGHSSEFALNVIANGVAPGITVTPSSGLVSSEAGGTASFTVVLNTAPSANVSVALSLSDPSEAMLSTGTLIFTPANWNLPQTVTVTGVDDSFVDGNVGYTIITAAALSIDPAYSGIDPADVAASNLDNDIFNAFYVTNTSDTANGDTTSIGALIANDGGDGISLREAIVAANNTANGVGGVDQIRFALAGVGVHTIGIGATGLPDISDAVLIDGWSDSQYAGTPVIELNGAGVGAGIDGIRLLAGSNGSSVRGLIVNRFSGTGIEISNSNNQTIQGNWIGLDASGSVAAGNGAEGIFTAFSANNLIGGLTAASRNVISGNGQQGIYFDQTSSSTISGNYIGTDVTGTLDVNGSGLNLLQSGIVIRNGSSDNLVGGTSTGAGNVLSGNNHYGFEVQNSSSINNLLQGNYIGVDASGLSALGNSDGGVSFSGAGTGNLFGGSAAGAGNVIAGNANVNVLVGNSSVGATIQGNYIGVGADGVTAIGNNGVGILVEGPPSNTLIGSDNNGSNDAAERNVIAYNTYGVLIADPNTTGTTISRNEIYSNSVLGIDLNFDGVSNNDNIDLDVGPNGLQNTPVLTTASTTGTQLSGSGTLNSTFSSTYRIELYANASADPSGHGQGQRYLTSFIVSTDGTGNSIFGYSLPVSVAAGESISATATNLTTANTSEFALNVTALAPSAPSFTNPGPQIVNEDTSTALPGLSFSDADGDLSTVALSVANGRLTVSLVGGATIGAGANNSGALTLSGSQTQINSALASLSYQGNLNFNGGDTLNALATDGTALSTSTSFAITVTAVNDAPLLQLPAAQAVAENTPLVFNAANGNSIAFSDADAAAGSVQATLSVSNGTLTLASVAGLTFTTGDGLSDATMTFSGTLAAINAALDGLGYLGASNYSGADSLQLALNDQGNSGSGGAQTTVGSVAIAVSGVNNAPTISAPAAQSVNEDSNLVFSGANAITLADIDAGSGPLAVVLTVAQGSLALAGTTGLTFTVGTGSNDATMSFSGTLAAINGAMNGLIYRGNADFSGADNLQITVDDQGNTGSGGAASALQNVALTVVAINDAPVFASANIALTIAENNVAVTTVTATDIDLPAQTLSYSIAGGTDAGLFTVNASTGAVSFIGAPDFESPLDGNADGIYDAQIQAADGLGGIATTTLAVTVANTNEAPTAITLSNATVAENANGGTAVGSAQAADPDISDVITYQLLNDAGGRFIIDPVTGLISVGNGALLDFEQSTSHNIVVQATDSGGLNVAQALTIRLSNVNEAAVLSAPATQTIVEDTSLVFSTSNGNAIAVADPDGAAVALRLTLVANNGVVTLASTAGLLVLAGTGVADSTVTIEGDSAALNAALNGLVFTAGANFSGNAVIQLVVDDPGNSGSGGNLITGQQIDVTVTAVNDAPTDLLRVPALTIEENAPVGTPAGTIVAVDPDDSSSFTYSLIDNASHFTIDSSSGALTVFSTNLPDFDVSASYLLIVRATDPQGAATDRAFTVDAVRRAVVSPPPAPREVGQPTGTPTAGATDPSTGSSTPTNSASSQDQASDGRRGDRVALAGSDGSAERRRAPPIEAGIRSAARDTGEVRTVRASMESQRRSDEAQALSRFDAEQTRKQSNEQKRFVDSIRFERIKAADDSNLGQTIARLVARAPLEQMSWEPEQQRTYQVAVDAIHVSGAALSVGMMFYLMRAGGLVTAMLSAIPAWTSLDPLVVLAKGDKRDDDWHGARHTEMEADEAGVRGVIYAESELSDSTRMN